MEAGNETREKEKVKNSIQTDKDEFCVENLTYPAFCYHHHVCSGLWQNASGK